MKAEPSCHQPVDVRSPGVRLAAGADYVGPLVVGEQQQDVGQLGRRAGAMSKASAGFQLVTSSRGQPTRPMPPERMASARQPLEDHSLLAPSREQVGRLTAGRTTGLDLREWSVHDRSTLMSPRDLRTPRPCGGWVRSGALLAFSSRRRALLAGADAERSQACPSGRASIQGPRQNRPTHHCRLRGETALVA